MKKITCIALALTVSFATVGCTPRIGPNNYTLYDSGKVNKTHRGQIIGMRAVTISGGGVGTDNQPGTGAGIGAASGALLGSTIGQGRGTGVAMLAGLAVGAVAGHYAGQKLTDQEGFEYQIQLDRGDILTIAQGAEPALRMGQRVLVVVPEFSGDRGRVIPDNTIG